MKRTLLLVSLAIGLSHQSSHASGITFASDLPDSLAMVNAAGNQLSQSQYTFQFGTFVSGFNPASNPLNTWDANWKLLGNAIYTETDALFGMPYVSMDISFDSNNSTVVGLTNSPVFSAGEQAYLWVRSSTEWALVTDNSIGTGPDDIWRLPDPTDAISRPLTWSLNNANAAVIGSVNNGTYRLQTADVTAVVPEPTSAMLILMGGVALRAMRGRSRRLA